MPAPGAGVRSRGRVVAFYSLFLVAVGGVLTAVAVALGNPVHQRPVTLPWWVLGILFAGAQNFVLNVQSKRESRSVGLTEIPFVIGLALASPLSFAIARILGCVIERGVISRQWRRPSKLAFNTALATAEIGVGLCVFHAMAGTSARSPATWTGAGAAATAAGIVTGVAVSALIARLEGDRLRAPAVMSFLRTSLPLTIGIASVGLVATAALVSSIWTAVPLVMAGALIGIAYRAYARQVERHENVERLYEFSQSIAAHTDTDAVVSTVLGKVCELLQAEGALLTFFAGADPQPHTEAVAHRGAALVRRPATYLTRDAGWIVDQLCRDEQPLLLARDTKHPATRHWLDSAGIREAMLAPVRGERGIAAALIVVDRLGEVRGFDEGDLQLLQTAANHASVALRHGRLVDQLRHDSLHDSLTGVPNRAYLQRELARQLSGAGRGVAIVMLDLDTFKEVNDAFGHDQGDALLCEVADRLTAAVGGRAVVSRFGGDEFALLVPHCESDEDAEYVCRLVSGALDEPIDIDGTGVNVSASMGIARAPVHASTWVDLMKRADVAMYTAKQSGREIVVYDPAYDTSSPSRLALVSALRQAITAGELSIQVQPQVSLSTDTVVSVEALARWNRPGMGLVPPDEFIPLAEHSGLIRPLTNLVLEQSIAACADWQSYAPEVAVAVNLSARSLRDDDLDDQVARLLRRYRLPPRLLTLEITESSVMADPAGTLGLLHRLRLLGVRLSIDDFGTGYSSLAYLRRLPVNEVKIDRSFVHRMHEEDDDAAIVRSIIELGRTLGLNIVAEGVEVSETYAVLGDNRCDFAQGYYISRPLPVEEFAEWMATTPWHQAHRPVLRAIAEA